MRRKEIFKEEIKGIYFSIEFRCQVDSGEMEVWCVTGDW
jgi:hypothetical protein